MSIPQTPDLDGYLEKLKHKSSYFGSWTKRYFRTNMEKNRLDYFPSRSSAFDGITKPSGSVQLENLRSVKKFDEFLFQIDAGPDGVYMLRADSYANLACWVNELDRYIKARQEYERWDHSASAEKSEDRLRHTR